MKRTLTALAVLSALLTLPTLTACVPEYFATQERQVTISSDYRITPVQGEMKVQDTEAARIWQAVDKLELTPTQRQQVTALLNSHYPSWDPETIPSIGIRQVENTLSRHEHALVYGDQPTSIGLAVVEETLTEDEIKRLARERRLIEEPTVTERDYMTSVGLRQLEETRNRDETRQRYGTQPTPVGVAVVPEDALRWAQRSNRFHEHLSQLLTEEQLALYELYQSQGTRMAEGTTGRTTGLQR